MNPEFSPFHESYAPFYSERTVRLHTMLINCGHQCVTGDYSWDGMKRGRHDMVIWQYTLSGMGRLRFGELEYPVPPGRGMLLIAPENHCYFLPEDSPGWEFLYVSFHGSEAVRLAGEFRRRNGVLGDFSADSRTVSAAWEILRMCRARQLVSRYDASAAAYRFLMALLADTDRGKQGESDRFHRKVHDYCLEHLAEPLDVAKLAEAVGCSRSHFSRRFRKEEGISPHEFIIRLKMRLAVRLLQTTTASVKEIAAQCGFDDVSYFCKVFRKVHSLTPGEYRSGGSELESGGEVR
ncbi:AraC family transcriptional regulator [uncultured Victivallis sp.]|uniref:AraC family transcriptional regulator n=1 Tax=uncultured Victivallis sp. TaxID=354118 RepID=UPI0025EFC200|nr:AraC family transcriptional regulator [uncultured Victivallis sp.]